MSASRPRVLVVDDEADVRLLVSTVLERGGLDVLQAASGAEALRTLYAERPDAVVLDVTMPGLDGWQVLERIRELSDVPVLMLTARAAELEKVRGLGAGADDYVTKPFGNQELLARVKAVLRRARDGAAGEPAIHDDGLVTIDFRERTVRVRGEPVALTPLEFKLLAAFVRHPRQVLSAEQIIELVWRDPLGTSRDQVKLYVGYLRRKLRAAGAEPIETVRGFGYRYVAPAG